MRIYADENIEHSIVAGLRRRNIEVIHISELDYSGKPDEFHLIKAYELKAVVLTHDADFIKLASSSKHNHAGIIYAHSVSVSIGECIRGVELIVKLLTDEDMENHIEFI